MKTRRTLVLLCGLSSVALTTLLLWPSSRPGEKTPTGVRPAPPAAHPIAPPAQAGPAAPLAAQVPGAPAAEPSATDFGAWALEPVPVPDLAKIDAFDAWIARWKEAAPEPRVAMAAEGAQLAQERRAEFKALIVSDPRTALARAVPRVVRQDLPKEIVDSLELPVSAKGDLNVYQGRPAEGMELRADQLTLRYFETGGTSYKARVFGGMEYITTRQGLPLQGVALDREMAVAENAVRSLEIGERIPAGTVVEETCPVSKETTEAISSGEPVTAETPTVEIAGRVITLCNGSHVIVLENEFRNWVQASGPGGAGFFMDNFPGTSSRAIGNFRCLYIRVTYPEQIAAPNTEEEAYGDMRNTARYYLEGSYGKMTTTTSVTSLLTLPHTMAWYKAKDSQVDGLGLIHNESREAARRAGYDPANFDCIIVRINGGPRLEGISWGGGSSVWITWGGMDVLNHECGHSLGRNHANSWDTNDGTAYGNGSNGEYGNPFDVMGGSGGFSAHYNTISKRALGWLPAEYVHQPKTNGVYRLHAYDQPQLEEGKRYAITLSKDSIRQYNIEYHPARGGLLADSALVLYSGMGSNAGHILDTTPGSAGGKGDGGIAIGRTYSDLESDQHFTVVGKNSTSPPSLDVAYFRGPFLGNQVPTLALGASATTISAGGSVTFTATANDADGDALAYHWDFDDGVTAPNSAVVTRSFSTVAQVTAMLTVSDMKGGVARRHVVINVGSHGKQTVTGTVTWNAQPLQNVRVSTGSKYAYTDASGNYALSGLNTGASTLAATLNGFSFTPLFTNPLTVTAGANTANWTASNSTFVTLARTADATEGGASGSFTFTRSGDTSADLIVRVSPTGGSAVKTTDYTFTPDHATDGSYRTFTIPADQASLAVTVAAVNDTAQEGPETITLQLASNGDYLSNSGNAALMTINDNDTALPQVAVISPDPYAMEAPADPGKLAFTRTGSTAAALNLAMVWSGTATNGGDYTTLPATVTIPAGQSSHTVDVNPLNDSAIEVPETVVATISTNAAYVIDPAAPNTTVALSDDDTPMATVSVPDPTASEAGPDSALFLIHRSGSTAAALKVYYGVHGTALHGTDYAALTGEVTIPAGATSAPVVIAPYNDDLGEAAETIVLAVTTFNNGYSLGGSFQGTATITDNADTPVISLRAGSIGTEGGSNASVVFRAVGTSGGNVTVNYTASGTATSGSDFTALSGSVVIPASGTNDVTVNIPVTNDATAEATETVIVTITPGAAYRVYNSASAEAIIRDNDSGGDRVMVSTANQSPTESGTTGSYYFSRTGTTGDLTVNYAVSGTATNGSDYTALPGTVVIPDGQSGVDLVMTPTDDATVEGTETVTLTVLPGTGYGADRPVSATYEIADSESPAITVGFQAATVTTNETDAGGEYRNIPVVLSAASADTVTVDFTSAGGSSSGDDVDWAFVTASNVPIPNGTLTYAPGVISQNLRIRIKNDDVAEPVETAMLELRAPRFASLAPGLGRQSWLIFDNAPSAMVLEERWSGGTVYSSQTWSTNTPNYAGALYSFTPPQNVTDNYSRRLVGQIVAPTTGTYKFWIASDDASRLYLSTTSSAAQKVQIATLSGYTSFQNWDANASQASANITLTGGQSYYMEVQHQEGGGGDHISVAWQGPSFSRTPITLATPDNTAPRFVRMASAATTRTEADGGEPLLMAVLDRPAGSTAVTVDYNVTGTATAGSDYTLAPDTLTFAPGEQSKALPLSIIADAVGEVPEAIVVSLANPAGASLASPSTHVITVQDAATPLIETLFATATSAMSSGTSLGTVPATPPAGRTITGWAILAGNSGNLFAINSAGVVTLVTPGGLPNPGGVQLVVRATDSAGATGEGLVNIVCNAPAQGVVEQRWNGSDAFWSEDWSGTAAYTGTLASFTTGQGVADNYSRRLSGYLKPQVSGDYTFWVAGDDDCRLYFGADGSASSKTLIAAVNGWTNFQAWDSKGAQKSAVIPLVGGKVYWLEAQQLEGGGGDHVSVAWQGPGISRVAIPSSVIFPNVAGLEFDNPPVVPTIAVTSPAAGTVFNSGDNVTITANVAGGSLAVTAVEFYRGSTLIGSDGSPPYSVVWTGAVIGSHMLTAKATFSGGGVSSSGIAISVDGVDPAGDPDGDGFTTGLELALGTDPNSSGSQPPAIYANLRAWWKLDETTGSTADDTTGRAQEGTVSGAAWSSGTLGNALTFDGVDDGVLVGTSAAVVGSGNFSLTAWVKVNPGSPLGTVIQQREPGASGHLGEYMVNVNANGTVNFFVYNNVYQFDLTTTAAVNDGQWHHLTALRDGTSGKIYIDGVEAASGSGAVQALLSRAVSIGYDHRDANKRFTGQIDDVRIYERALVAGELDTLAPNRAPAFTTDPLVKAAATEDSAYSGSLSGDASDPDSGDTRSYSKLTGPAWLSVATDGTLSGIPGNGNVGANGFTVRVTDVAGLSDDASLAIAVTNTNDAPAFTADPITGDPGTEDAAYSGTLAGAATDVDAGDNLIYAKLNGPAWLTVATNGTLSGTPPNANAGPNVFTVRVTDSTGLTNDAVLNIAVANVNDAPSFTADPIGGASATEDEAYSGSLAGFGTDIDAGDSSSYSKINGPAWLNVAANGALSGTPPNGNVGGNSFTVRVTDGGGLWDEAALHISVANVNDAPVFTVDPITRAAGTEEVAYGGPSLAGTAADADAGDALTYSKSSGPAWLSVAANGALSGTPPLGSAGMNNFVVHATDISGASDEAALSIDIQGAMLPLPWDDIGVGSGNLAGSATHSGGTFTLDGSGLLSGTADTLHYTWQTLTGDGSITARVSSLQNTGTSSRVGVMIRDSLSANSRHVFMGLASTGNYRWVRRTSTGGSTSTSNSSTGTVPNTWVRLVRSGNTVTAYKSSNGTSWTQVGSLSATFPANCYIGLAVASGSNGTLNSSQFSSVTVVP